MELNTWKTLKRFAERESHKPDLGRALRATFAVMVPLLLAATGSIPFDVSFMAFAAQSVALVDVRGAYTVRLGLLLAMTVILAASVQLGSAVSGNLVAAVLGAGVIAVTGGLWRHLIPDYGGSLAVSSTLLFVISVNFPASTELSQNHALGALVGGLWGVLLQVANWPIRPQHPLRRAVSDSWVAVADLFSALESAEPTDRSARIREAETALRNTLNQTYAALAADGSSRKTALRLQLEELNLSAARIATRVVALNTAIESALDDPDLATFSAALQPVLLSLTNASRSVALAVVSRQPSHLTLLEVRLRRLGHLLQVFEQSSVPGPQDGGASEHVRVILRQIAQQLPDIHDAVRATIDRADERAAFSLELFDLDTWTLRPLASALIVNRRIDPVLIRFTARVAVLTMMGVGVFKFWNLTHGYWLPLTMVIVLQPDYGSTRQRAAQRVLGTLAGSIAATLLLWLRLPWLALSVATATTVFSFGFFIKRNYAVAVFFVTLMVVLLTETHGTVTLWFTVERMGSTLAGGVIALLAALFFWPVWERDRLPAILASAIETNRNFLEKIAESARAGSGYDAAAIAIKRRAESANSAVFSSLQRMMGDPRNQQDGLEEAAALANGNQRVTRAFTVLALQLAPGSSAFNSDFNEFAFAASNTLDAVAQSVQKGEPVPTLANRATALQRMASAPDPGSEIATSSTPAIRAQLPRIATELVAMTFAASRMGGSTPTPAASTAT